jgi:hypothetical protein
MRTSFAAVAALSMGALATWALAQAPDEAVPEADVVVERACQAAGGWDAFKKGAVLKIAVSQEEITQDGKVTKTQSGYVVKLPGPTPARFEFPTGRVIAGDDGTGGWAVVQGRPDARPSTAVMIKRIVQSDLFSIMLPFSLRWADVILGEVHAADVKGRPVWRLTVEFPNNFFSSPQIGTKWTVDVDRKTSEIVSAESPATDLGRGITADGLRYSWSKPVRVGPATLHSDERVVGIDQVGNEKSHTRTRLLSYEIVANANAEVLFGNPVPPDQRPSPSSNIPPPSLPPVK